MALVLSQGPPCPGHVVVTQRALEGREKGGVGGGTLFETRPPEERKKGGTAVVIGSSNSWASFLSGTHGDVFIFFCVVQRPPKVCELSRRSALQVFLAQQECTLRKCGTLSLLPRPIGQCLECRMLFNFNE